MSFISDVLPPLLNETWKDKITHYFERVSAELLDLEKRKEHVMARLAAEQSKVEAFAMAMNSMTSTLNGIGTTAYIYCFYSLFSNDWRQQQHRDKADHTSSLARADDYNADVPLL